MSAGGREQRGHPAFLTARMEPLRCAGLSLALGCYAAGLIWVGARASLWGDEGFTAGMVALPWRTMWSDLAHIDVNMSVYYAAVWWVTRVLGHGEAALRLVSALSIAASVPLVARLARQVLGHRRGLPAALLFGGNPFVVLLGATARPYALLVLGTLVTTLAVMRALRTDRSRDAVTWAVLSAVLLYVHMLAALVIAAQALYLAASLAVSRARASGGQVLAPTTRRTRAGALARRLLPPLVVLALAPVPTVLFIAPADTLNWVPPPSVAQAVLAARVALGGPLYVPLLLLAGTAGAVALACRGAPHGALLALLLAVPVIAILALLPFQSLLVPFYLSPLAAPLSLLAAHGLWVLPGRRAATLGVGAALLAGTVTVGHSARTGSLAEPQDWRTASRRLDAEVGTQDAVGFPNAFYRIVAEYYADGDDRGWTRARPVLPRAPWRSLRPYQLDRLKRTGEQAGRGAVLAEADSLSSIWLAGPPEPLLEDAVAALTATGFADLRTIDVRGVRLVHLGRARRAQDGTAARAVEDATPGAP